MAASKPEIMMILDIVQQYSGAKDITMQTNREWKIQDGGHRTESIYISASGRYSKDILMAIGLPMFMGSSTPIALRKSLCKKRKWKIIQDAATSSSKDTNILATAWPPSCIFTSGLVVQHSTYFRKMAGPQK
mgnify:CR=1 FL=1